MANLTDQVNQSFPCTQCGLCCQYVHLADETRFLDRGDGICRHYSVVNKSCTIYEKRPDICRINRQYELNYHHLYSWEEFVTLNMHVCNQLTEL
jgi:Fe-S-cluster containining protein